LFLGRNISAADILWKSSWTGAEIDRTHDTKDIL